MYITHEPILQLRLWPFYNHFGKILWSDDVGAIDGIMDDAHAITTESNVMDQISELTHIYKADCQWFSLGALVCEFTFMYVWRQ